MSPTVVGPVVTVGSCAGVLYAFHIQTGDVAWQQDVSVDGATQFHGNPALIEGRMLIGTDQGADDQGSLYAFDAVSGAMAWKRQIDPGLPSDVCVFDSTVYVISKDDEVWALSARTGREVWRSRLEAETDEGFWRLVSSPVIMEDMVVFGDRNRRVHALDAATGELRWSRRLESRITTQPCALESLVVFGTRAGTLVFLRATDGQIIHTQELESIPTATMSARGEALYFLSGNEDDRPRDVIALDWRRHVVLWTVALDDPDPEAYWFVPRLHFWGDDVLVGSTEGLLVAYDARSGLESWRKSLQGALRGIGSTPKTLFVGNLEGMLFALRKP